MKANTKKYNYTYEITNTLNNMKYIGVHSDDLSPDEDNYMGTSKYLDAAMIEDGEENFIKIILGEFRTRKEAIQHEIDLHIYYNVKNNDVYYNKSNQTSTGFDWSGNKHTKESLQKMREGSLGRKHTAETRKKMSDAQIGHSNGVGYKHTDEAKQKISATHKGRVVSEETRKKIREANLGYKHTDEAKQKMREAHKGRVVSEETRKKIGRSNLGKKHTEESKKKIGESSKGRIHTDEAKQKISEANLGYKHTDEAKQKISEAKRGLKHKIVTCPHCDKKGGDNNMYRYHFDNCKFKGDIT